MGDGPTVTVVRAAELLHCGRTRVYELLAEGRIVRAPKFGRVTVITTESVLAAAVAGVEPAPKVKPPRKSRGSRMREAVLAIPVARPT